MPTLIFRIPLNLSGELIITKDEENDAILTCMLEHVMSTPANDFGFDDPPVVCWPPAYDNIGAVCLESLAKPAYDKCTENKAFFDAINEDMALDEEVHQYMSMSMSMSMDYDDDDAEDDEFFKDNDMSEMMLIARFCDIMERITTDKGLECLGIICDNRQRNAFGCSVSGVFCHAFGSVLPQCRRVLLPKSHLPCLRKLLPQCLPHHQVPLHQSRLRQCPRPHRPRLQALRLRSKTFSRLCKWNLWRSLQSIWLLPTYLTFWMKLLRLASLAHFQVSVESKPLFLRVNGNNIRRRRRLQNVVPVQFRVDVTKPCYLSDCNGLATSLIADLNDALLSSVVDGSMETLIRQEAATQSVDELTTANVIANSYQLISSDSQLNEPIVVVNPEEVQSSAPLVSTTVTGLVVLLLVTFVAC